MQSKIVKIIFAIFIMSTILLAYNIICFAKTSSIYENNEVCLDELNYNCVYDNNETTKKVESTEMTETTETTETVETEAEQNQADNSFQLDVKCTAYCSCSKCCGRYAKNRPLDESGKPIILTASGEKAKEGITVGVDPKVIPLGSKIIIDGHEYTAQDTGNSKFVKNNVIDVYFDNHEEASEFGVQYFTATIIPPSEEVNN